MGKSKDSPLIYRQFSIYFSRYAYPVEYLKNQPVAENLNIIVTIPCYNEPDLLKTLNSIDIDILMIDDRGFDVISTDDNNKNILLGHIELGLDGEYVFMPIYAHTK